VTQQPKADAVQTSIMACMRNECIFALEWVAFHRVIGFDHVLVCTNDCDDGTDVLMERLAALGLVHHIRNEPLGGLSPQPAGVRRVLAHPDVRASRWLLHIDADEFLNVLDGEGRLIDWLPRIDGFDAAAITWRLFGDAGLTEWPEGGLQTECLTLAAERARPFTAMQKTIFDPTAFAAGIDHMPKAPTRDVTLCTATGRALDPGAMSMEHSSDHREAGGGAVNRMRHLRWEGAVVNHYAVRSRDIFLLKNHRGDGMRSAYNKRYFLHSRWHRAANANHVEDRSILRHLPAVKALLAEWRAADPEIAELEADAHAWLRQMRREWLTEARIAELTNPAVKVA
jgi:hypothetical protein